MSLQASALVTGYGGQRLLGPLELRLDPGRLVCLIGANGSGKSTLIRTLCGMQAAFAGEVRLDGRPLHAMPAQERARRLSIVLTDRIAATLMTGYQLASLGRYPHIGWAGRLSEDDHRIVGEALRQVDALPLAGRMVSDMSDGERQKVMIARALAQGPQLLVLDEATAFLDLPRRIDTMQLLLDLARQRRLAVLLSTHDLELALRYADQLWMIDSARRMHVGAPEDIALNGALAATFAADGLSFDLESGELRVGRAGSLPVRLEGQGVASVWARRALRRAGYEVCADAPLMVRAGTGQYLLQDGSAAPLSFTCLGDLVEALARRRLGAFDT